MAGLYVFAAVITILQVCTLYIFWRGFRNKKEEDVPAAGINITGEAEFQQELIRTMELHCLRIRNAVARQTEMIHHTEMKLAPKELPGADERLLEFLSDEQKVLIEEFENLFHTYLQSHWLSSRGELKTVFSGSADHPGSDAAKLMYASKTLRDQMDKWFISWRENV